ncbi:acylpyruvase FAHD1, mitochondrial isoform X2 [Diorhabda carinulata]|uniref:acylpyruvase FAHD1, mitochondrial isoform X2 n=1 Tax=Diorhabda carinulata TaxID=1163345 RepID=UPI0025A27D7A|nr:acylpyruvase FAHD1, mitochondrial isoform X2 [Diorhabda carinulata]
MSSLNLFATNGKKILGVTSNYKSLIKVLKIDPPKTLDVFMKPSTSYITEGPIVIPKGFLVNQEIELGVVIGKKAKKVCEQEAMDYIGGYCAGLDMTAVNKITEARSKGGPWTIAKGFDTATPVSKFIPKTSVPDPYKLQLWCSVNGKLRQDACTSDLLFNLAHIISFISSYITLEPNDMILTGAPPNFGPVKDKDVITGGIRDLVDIKFEVIEDK